MKCIHFRACIALCLLFIFGASLLAQQGYIVTDSSKSTVLSPRSGSSAENSKFIRVWSEGEIVRKYPADLSGYGLPDGRVYISREIEFPDGKRKVFLERKTFRDLCLLTYDYKGGYLLFLEPDDLHFIPLTQENYRSELGQRILDCPDMKEALGSTKFSKKSIERLLRLYQRCKGGLLPFSQFGFSLGYAISTFEYPKRTNDIGLLAFLPDFPNDYFARGDFQWNSSLMGGVFADLPIGISAFSFQTGLQLTLTEFEERRRVILSDIDFQGNFLSLELPINIRYTVLNRRWRPYFQMGTSFSHNFEGSAKLFESQIGTNMGLPIEIDSDELIADNMYGIEAVMGFSRLVGDQKWLSVELGAKRTIGFSRALILNYYTIALNYSFSK